MSNKLVAGRLSSLDSIRGIAAFSVVLLHLGSVYLHTSVSEYSTIELAIKLLLVSPLGILIDGAPAVPVFFVLSGFVLTLMLERGMNYREYLVRRVIRLYIPYIASIACAVSLIAIVGSHKIPELSDWANIFLGVEITWESILDHVVFVGVFDTTRYNFPIWTLVHEMRISLFFPLLLAAVLRYGWKRAIAGFLCLSVVSILVGYYIRTATPFPLWQSVADTGFWTFFLVVGASLAVKRDAVTAWYKGLSRNALAAIWVLAGAIYILPVRVSIFSSVGPFWALISLPGVAFFIIAAFSSLHAIAFLEWKPLRFLGKISYSLYLCHAILLVTGLTLFYDDVPTWLLLVGVFVASLCVATVAFHVVERPAIMLGAFLGTRVGRLTRRPEYRRSPV
ncbi:MAG: acyltransferase family protein [Panacagrimonas sp.]